MIGTDASGAVIVASGEIRPDVMEGMTTTWTWTRSRWNPIRSDPNLGSGGDLAYDPVIRKTIAITGGMTGTPYQMWAWDGTSWEESHPAALPRTGWSPPALAYDPATQQLVALVTESQTTSTTWTYDGNTWIKSATAVNPPPRYQAGLAYDPGSKKLVLYGGNCVNPGVLTLRDDTWTWDGQTWSLQHPDTTPGGGCGLLAYDSLSSQMVLVLQHPTDATMRAFSMSTWTWTGTTWRGLHPATSPPAVWFAHMAYDSLRHEVVFFAHPVDATDNIGQTWVYSAGTWRRAN